MPDRLWDKAIVEGRMTFPGLVEQATIHVPRLKAAGCSLIVVAAHSGATVLASVQAHSIVTDYVNSVIGTSAAQLLAARAVVEDVPIIDFVNFVQADAVRAGLSGDDAALPVLSIAAPFNRGASFPSGEVTVRDVAGLYIYDNTLVGVKFTGAH